MNNWMIERTQNELSKHPRKVVEHFQKQPSQFYSPKGSRDASDFHFLLQHYRNSIDHYSPAMIYTFAHIRTSYELTWKLNVLENRRDAGKEIVDRMKLQLPISITAHAILSNLARLKETIYASGRESIFISTVWPESNTCLSHSITHSPVRGSLNWTNSVVCTEQRGWK